FKTTFIWVIVLSAVAGLSYMDWEKTRVDEERREEQSRLFKFQPPEVVAITLEKEGSAIEIERWEDGWKITKPVNTKADSAAVEKFLNNVVQSRNDADYVMDPNPTTERLEEFGLANPSVTLTMKVGKDLTPHTVLFGDRAPTMGVAFARVKGDVPVYRVLADSRSEADKDVYYFRDKTVLRLNPIMVDQLSIIRQGSVIRLKLPDGGHWVIEKPMVARADHNRVFEFMGGFYNAEAKEFIEETKSNLEKYGLDNPMASLSFWQAGDSEATVTLNVGGRNPEKRGYYASMSDRENIFLLGEELVNAIPRAAQDLRSRQVFYLDNDRLERIEIIQPGKSAVLVRDMEKEWHRDSVKGEKVEFNLVKEFMDGLASVTVKDFVNDNPKNLNEYGLDQPSAQILLYLESNPTPLRLSLGSKAPTGYIYGQSGDEKSILALDDRVRGILNLFM
ncbi:MAG: DUF4340 domain-containing protein, partial [Nitrospinota bacterium]|nr:DUF4340 domain-containing protein [Nitrospinota bacterium]